MKKKFLALISLALVVAMMMAGCAKPATTTEETKPETTTTETTTEETTEEATEEVTGDYKYNTSGEELTFGFTALNMNNPFYVRMLDRIKELAATENVTIVENDGQMDAMKQSTGMEDFVNMGVDGVLCVPVDTNAIVPSVQLCNTNDIPVIAVDNNVAGGEIVSYIASDNYMGGELVGKYLAERLGGEGKICVIDYPVLEGCVLRVDGLMAALSEYPGIEVLSNQMGGDMTQGQKLGETWMQQYGDEVDVIFGINDPNALGALTAAEAAGNTDLFVVGIDGSDEGIAAMKEGRNFGATAQQDPEGMGEAAFIAMLQHINGEEVESEIKVPTPLITVDDVQ